MKKKVLVTVISLCTVVMTVKAQRTDMTREDIITVDSGRFRLNGRTFIPRGVNYYPVRRPWRLFWSCYDSSTVRKDLGIMQGLGFNTIRIFVGSDSLSDTTTVRLRVAQLGNMLDLADQRQMKVIVTLFDFLGDYDPSTRPAVDRHLNVLLTAFSGHKALFAWDIKNEPDLDLGLNGGRVKEWLEWILPRARAYDSCHLITIGWAHPENAVLFHDRTDFVSFHSYRPVHQLAMDVKRLSGQLIGKPLLLEECGLSTYDGQTVRSARKERRQSSYFSKVRKILRDNGDIPFLVWTLYDFQPEAAAVVGKTPREQAREMRFGVLRTDGSYKPAVKVLIHP